MFIAGALFGFATKCGFDESERGGMVEMHTNRWPWGLMVDIVTHGGRGLVCVSIRTGRRIRPGSTIYPSSTTAVVAGTAAS